MRSNKVGTFLVKIVNTQNATWQGNVTWIEEQKSRNFRSALELLKLIDGAIGQNEKQEGGSHEE